VTHEARNVVSRTFVARTSEMTTFGADAAVCINVSTEAINQSAIPADRNTSQLQDFSAIMLLLS
ncbi:MAG: hypothetical protein JSV36_08150, partial [Anaerolineae bacterium]